MKLWTKVADQEGHCTWAMDVADGVVLKDEDYDTETGNVISKAMVYVPCESVANLLEASK